MAIKLDELHKLGASVIELNMCQSRDYKFKNDQLYYFKVNPICPECVRIFEENLGRKA